ncbi:hypothetical protein [Brevibacillus daliensis]|uniref:hypothetical protein n=1 Tax=Brevibacillus daliensis TaxID=2892995 RepID=UPI001E52EA15|nr:hypothetical protein [Brevibacillus daliensis]
MMKVKNGLLATMLITGLLVTGCGANNIAAPEQSNVDQPASEKPAEKNEANTSDKQLGATFDPENPKEYGIRGIYIGQGIEEAMGILKPVKADFMDSITREPRTIEQMAASKGEMTMGILLIDQIPLMVQVQDGVLSSIMVGGIPEEKKQDFATNRGVTVYDKAEKLQEVYGNGEETETEISYKGSKYKVAFSLNQEEIIGYRFDIVTK